MFYPENEAHAKPTSTHLMAINFLKHQLARRPASFAWLQKGGKLMNYDRRIPIKNTTKRSSMPIKTRQNDLVCRLKPDKTPPFLPAAIRLQIHTLQQMTMPCLIAGAPKLNGRSVTSGKYQKQRRNFNRTLIRWCWGSALIDHWRRFPQSSRPMNHLKFTPSLKRRYLQDCPAWLLVVLSSDTFGKVSETNRDKLVSHRPTKARERKVAIRTLLPQELAPNDDDWAASKFPPFRPLFAAIPSTLILTLPPRPVLPVRHNHWRKSDKGAPGFPCFASFSLSSLLRNLIHCFSVFSSISVAAPSYLSLSFDCHLIKKFHFLPKMETSPSSPRINQTRGGEEWKCENRNSRGREMRNARGKISFQNVWVLVRGFRWWGNIGVVGA